MELYSRLSSDPPTLLILGRDASVEPCIWVPGVDVALLCQEANSAERD